MANKQISLALLGATGYTGLEALRLAHMHPAIHMAALATHTHRPDALAQHMPLYADLPSLQHLETMDWGQYDVVLSALPHGAAASIIADIPKQVKVVDMSADFRLKNAQTYAQWYGQNHPAPQLLEEAVYGLSEYNKKAIMRARLVACPGCYPTGVLSLLVPILRDGLISQDRLIIEAKTGVSGAGRKLLEDKLFCEVSEGAQAYNVGGHRHIPEMEQVLSEITGASMRVSFTPYLLPMNRGEIITIYAQLADAHSCEEVRASLEQAYKGSPFIHCLAEGQIPSTRQVRGTNHCLLAVFPDRIPRQIILMSVLDNLVKGSSGQALQNINLMFGLEEQTGLTHAPLFP